MFISGFKVGRRGDGMEASYLLFSYDALLLCEANVEHLRYWKRVLICFELMSELKINFEQTEIIPIGKVMGKIGLLVLLQGCMPSFYIPRIAFGSFSQSSTVWNSIEERFKRKLTYSKEQDLSHQIDPYQRVFIIIHNPQKSEDQTEKELKRVFMGNHLEGRKIHLMKWVTICKYNKY